MEIKIGPTCQECSMYVCLPHGEPECLTQLHQWDDFGEATPGEGCPVRTGETPTIIIRRNTDEA